MKRIIFWGVIFVFTSAFMLHTPAWSQAPLWNSWIELAPNPSPYFNDWENNPNSGSFFLQYSGGAPVQVTLRMSLTSDRYGEVLQGEGGPVLFTGPELRQIQTPYIIDWENTTRNAVIENQVRQTGRLPEGQYTVCVDVFGPSGTLLTRACTSFSIHYPDPPYLVAPPHREILLTPFPTFQWTPVQVPPNTPVTYHVRIVEVLQGQTLEQAIASNYVHFEQRLTGTSFVYPLQALPFEKGKTYAWQVQALDASDQPAASNDGKSQIWSFTAGTLQGTLDGPEFVYDGTSQDEDFTRSTSTLSANWAAVQGATRYLYAIGTSLEATDVLPWTDAGLSTQVTRGGLSLSHNTMYYISVKAVFPGGKESRAVSSDGIRVDTSRPESRVAITPPPGKSAAAYQNTQVFEVSWSGSDDVSPVTRYEIQYRFGGEKAWKTWLSGTDLTSATFRAVRDGRYAFRSRATDAAGNQSVFRDVEEAATIVDTKPPSSRVTPLAAQQSSTAFTVSWSGSDSLSGIESYDIQVQIDGGPWQDWRVNQIDTSGFYQGAPNHTYAFRSRAVDKAGNAEAYPPSPDTVTRVPATASQPPKLIVLAAPLQLIISVDDPVAHPASKLKFVAGDGLTCIVNEVEIRWYDASGIRYADTTVPLRPVIFNAGEAKMIRGFRLPYDALNKYRTKNKIRRDVEHQIELVYRGIVLQKQQALQEIPIQTDPVRIPLIDYSSVNYLSFSVEFAIAGGIVFSPGRLSNDLLMKLELSSRRKKNGNIDTEVLYWYDAEGALLKTEKRPIQPPIPISSYLNKTFTRTLHLSYSPAWLKQMLAGKSEANFSLKVEYSGKDQRGISVRGITEQPLQVYCYSATKDWRSLAVSMVQPMFRYDPSRPNQPIQFQFKWTGFAPATLTHYQPVVLYNVGTSQVVRQKLPELPLPRPLKLVPGPQTRTIMINGQTFQIPYVLTGASFPLPGSVAAALSGHTSSTYGIAFNFSGTDADGNPIFAETDTAYSVPPVKITATVQPSGSVFDQNHLVQYWNVRLNYSGKVPARLDSVYSIWFKESGQTFLARLPEEMNDPPDAFTPPSGIQQISARQMVSDFGRVKMLHGLFAPQVQGPVTYEGPDSISLRADYKMALEYVGQDSLGRRVVARTNQVRIVVMETRYPIEVEADPAEIVTSEPLASVGLTLVSTLKYPVTLQTRTIRVRKGEEYMPRPGIGPPLSGTKGNYMEELLAFGSLDVLQAKGSYVDRANIPLNLEWLLAGEEQAKCAAIITYTAKDSLGKAVLGRVYVPITVTKAKQVAGADTLQTTGQKYVLIPKVAEVQAIQGATRVSSQGQKRVLDGSVKLILLPSPFDSLAVIAEAVNLVFSPEGKGTWKAQGGKIFGEAAPAEKRLFSLIRGLLNVTRISYDHARANRLLINEANAVIPILDKKIYFKDLIINENGLDLKISEQEISAFGLTFRVKNLSWQSGVTGDVFSLDVNLRLKGKPKSEEFAATRLVIKDINGRQQVEMKAIPGKPVRLIPSTDYLNFTSFEFKEVGSDNWVLAVSVASSNLPIFGKLGPLTGTVEYERSGKIRGRLEPVRETQPGIENDKTVVSFGKWGKIDLTYLGVQFAGIQKISTTDGKPDTTWEFDRAQSFVGLALDLYLPFKGKVFGDPSGRIAIGSVGNPGIRIDFNGNVQASTITVASGKTLDLGPIFIRLASLAITPDPFALHLSGGLGVNMSGVVEGEIAFQGLTIDKDGNFTNFSDVVKGGNLSILKVVSLGIGDVKYSDQPTSLSFMKNVGKQARPTSIQVNSYFQLRGAHLNIGKNGAGGAGSFDELTVFTDAGNQTSFLLRRGNLKIQNTVDLTVDFQYVNNAKLGQYLSVGGGATIVNKIRGTIYGKVGALANGEPTWGFYLAASGLDINLAAVTLDEIGGGFFYNPTQEDIKSIRATAGFRRAEINTKIDRAAPNIGGTTGFAVFLAAGIYIGSDAFLHGRALMTITGRNWSLDAETQAIKVGSDYRVKGLLSLNVSWDPAFFEGQLNMGIDFFKLVSAKESDNYFNIYIYGEEAWGVIGKLDITLLFILNPTAEIYIGNQGFLFDTAIEASLDIGVLEGGIRLEAMVWWRPDVSWGIYASGKAWGEVLWGLVGAEIGMEGALLYNAHSIRSTVFYASGHLSIELCWVEIFNGRVWVTLGSGGWDGGKGENNRYDRLIADARKIGQKMEADMQELSDNLTKAREALFTLNEEQRQAAGQALLGLVQMAGFDPGAAFVKTAFAYAYMKDAQTGGKNPTLDALHKLIWNPRAAALQSSYKKLQEDSTKIRQALETLRIKTQEMQKRLQDKRQLMEEDLPSIADFGGKGSPVGPIQIRQVTVGGQTKQIYEYSFDPNKAKSLEASARKQKEDIQAYRKKLVSMVKDYSKKLNELDQLLCGGGTSISRLAEDYGATFSRSSSYTLNFLNYLNAKRDWSSKTVAWFRQREQAIRNALESQARRMSAQPGSPFKQKLIDQRIVLIQELLKVGGKSGWSPPDTMSGVNLAVNLGMEMWYHIPTTGLDGIVQHVDKAALLYAASFQNSNNLYQARWSLFTLSADRVYSRKVRLYTLLYDLLDQLSLEAGTRRLASADAAYLSTDRGSGLLVESPGWSVTGSLEASGQGASYPARSPDWAQPVQGGRQQNVSTLVPGPTGTGQKTTYRKPRWAREWDFEKERKKVKQVLQVPRIVQLEGSLVSDYNTNAWYAKLTLRWKAEHPIGIAEYSISLPGYSQPVSIRDLFPKSGKAGKEKQPKTGTPQGDIMSESWLQLMLEAERKKERKIWIQEPGPNDAGQISILGASANRVSPKGSSSRQDWRSVAKREVLVIPFLRDIHAPGSYEIWLRARGAGGYTIERKATITVGYPYQRQDKTASDFGPGTVQSTLNIADSTPPSRPVVYDAGDSTSSRTLLYARWKAWDGESGIQEYQYRVEFATQRLVGYVRNGLSYQPVWKTDIREPITPWLSAGGQTEQNIRLDRPMEPGRKYYIRVRARNGAGLWSEEGTSDGIQLSDPTPPSAPAIQAASLDQGLSATWSAASDQESGIIAYIFALGTQAGATDLIDWHSTDQTNLQLNAAALNQFLQQPLQKGKTYYFTVRAMNGIGVLGPPVSAALVVQ